MDILISIYIFMLGAALGSFALVVAERWSSKRSWVKGRSQCDSCKKTLAPRDLVPLFSWVVSKGRCRQCGKKVSARYPAAELVSATVLTAVYLWFPYEISLGSVGLWLFILWIAIHTITMILVFIDTVSMIMPYKLLGPLILFSVLFRGVILLTDSLSHPTVVSLIIGVLLGSGTFASLWLVSKGKWIGDSDILLAVAMGLIVGGAIEIWIAFIIASLSGLLWGVAVALTSHKKLYRMKIPFGPFLVFGMIVSFLFASVFIDVYTNLFFAY